jgi:hypothetical protein
VGYGLTYFCGFVYWRVGDVARRASIFGGRFYADSAG